MELSARNISLAESRAMNKKLTWAVLALVVAVLLLSIKLVTQSEVVINQTPGMPNGSVIEKTAMDKGAQMSTLGAVTSAMVQINPSNAAYAKPFLQVYLSPTAYTRVSQEIDTKMARLLAQRELGSYYFVNKGYQYDPALDRHFVLGDVHTVNAAKDTGEPYVFEYAIHIENYRLVVDEAESYPGDHPHDTEWRKANKKP